MDGKGEGMIEIKPGPGEVSIVMQVFTENKRCGAMLEFNVKKEGDKIDLDFDLVIDQCLDLVRSAARTLLKDEFLCFHSKILY